MRLGRTHLRMLLLLTAIAVGQWLNWAHASEHNALQAGDVACLYCATGVGVAHPASPGLASLDPLTRVESPAQPILAQVRRAALGENRIRGPPVYS